jgi:hypothetical protein
MFMNEVIDEEVLDVIQGRKWSFSLKVDLLISKNGTSRSPLTLFKYHRRLNNKDLRSDSNDAPDVRDQSNCVKGYR